MPQRAPAIHDDIIEAVREDDIEDRITEVRERQEAWGEQDAASLAFAEPVQPIRTRHYMTRSTQKRGRQTPPS